MEGLDLRVPDVIGQLLQPHKNMGKARSPPGLAVWRHRVLVMVAPSAGLRHALRCLSGWDVWAGWSGGCGQMGRCFHRRAMGATAMARAQSRSGSGGREGGGLGGLGGLGRARGGGALVVGGRLYGRESPDRWSAY